eukprot:CAMPEP_0198204152 /NCGR_PEP_ID=MMETSP1445-20131203/7535_1 /TAXON_ID=36898 /ORGANISM="Pyramimonas sp., Strain CCMP2087" /LENGTH=572 /DNA_ID=CAMNT_0043875893 /DNA_START=194 /DNA_END=1912 /DNA_ORIENTATION=+
MLSQTHAFVPLRHSRTVTGPNSRKAPGGTRGREVQLSVHASEMGKTVRPRRARKERAPLPPDPPLGFSTDLDTRYEVGDILGAGGMGVVRLATDRQTGMLYALKTMPKKRPGFGYAANMKHVRMIKQEIEIQMLLGKSLNCVSLYEVFEDEDSVHLLMENMSGGAMLDRAPEHDLYSEAQVAWMARAILQTLAQCHARKIVYRDVKPENYLYSSPGADASLKLSDFGLAIFHKNSEPPLNERCGTVAYVAPEVLHRSYDQKADLFSAGVLIYQLLSGKYPFTDEEGLAKDSEQVFSSILVKDPDFTGEPWDAISPGAVELIRALLNKDPSSRPSARVALGYDWIMQVSRENESTLKTTPLGGTVVARLQKFATAGALRRAVYATIEPYVDKGRGQYDKDSVPLHELFDQLDHSGSGSLTADDLVTGLTKDFGYNMSAAEAMELYTAMDIHRTGTISFDEFAAALEDWHALESDEQWGRWASIAFKTFQREAQGGTMVQEDRIQVEDLAQQVCESNWSGRGVCVEEVKSALMEHCAANDGTINLEEFTWIIHSSSSDQLTSYDQRLPTQNPTT